MSAAVRRFVAATANPHKLDELRAILGPGVDLLPRPSHLPDVVEDADTLEGNARLKAEAVLAATGLPSLADDTGLVVDALDGAPGVRSARYAGDTADDTANVAHLLAELDRVGATAPAARRARFVTVVVLADPSGALVVEGVCEGTIAASPRGDGGFGYDPVFIPDDGGGDTFAEMSAEDKHALSHRGRAVRRLGDALAADRRWADPA